MEPLRRGCGGAAASMRGFNRQHVQEGFAHMPSIARDHAEWLPLIESSGPFVSIPALLRVFPQGLDTVRHGAGRASAPRA